MATATFPLRQLGQLQVGSVGNAPETQPSTSARSNDAALHSIRGGRINRRDTAPRSGPRSSQGIDPQLLNELISALKPSGPPSSKFNRHQKLK